MKDSKKRHFFNFRLASTAAQKRTLHINADGILEYLSTNHEIIFIYYHVLC